VFLRFLLPWTEARVVSVKVALSGGAAEQGRKKQKLDTQKETSWKLEKRGEQSSCQQSVTCF
jgi:hypothetical protein